MSSEIETDDWKLRAFFEWTPKAKRIPCPVCYGRGVLGGGFKDIEGERQCDKCRGAKAIDVNPTSPQPEIPAGLREHMRRAWWDYVNKPQPPADSGEARDAEIERLRAEVAELGYDRDRLEWIAQNGYAIRRKDNGHQNLVVWGTAPRTSLRDSIDRIRLLPEEVSDGQE